MLKQWTNKVIQGDCLELMRELPDNCIDSIITDPPGGISFMGRAWDSDKGGRDNWIAWLSEVMKECLRVAKPGSMLVCWSIPRTSHWVGMAIEEAGWQVRDVFTHIFGSGFPKSLSISKAIDKMRGAERDVIGDYIAPDGKGRRGGKNPNPMDWSKDSEEKRFKITASATPEAAFWDGFGTGLKPAVEFWWLAMKPLDGTFAENALKWGVAGLNIDSGRIRTDEIKEKNSIQSDKGYWGNADGGVPRHTGSGTSSIKGRYPANVLFSCSCDYFLKSCIMEEDKKKLMDWLHENT